MEAVAFNPVVNLTHDQRGQVAHTIATPGFLLVNRIMRSEVDKFIIDLINVPEGDDVSVVAKHKLSKAAAQFYELVISRLNFEAGLFMRESSGGVPSDPTEGMIDLGEYSHGEDDQSGILEDYNEDPQLSEEELSSE